MRRFLSISSIGSLLSGGGPSFAGAPEAGTALAVIGDVHGYSRQFRALTARVEEEAATLGAERLVIVQVGDLIDRGPDSRGCVDHSRALSDRLGDGFVQLMGNHEMMMLYCARSDAECAEYASNWLLYGGRETMDSFLGAEKCPPVSVAAKDPAAFRRLVCDAVGEDRLEYLFRLPGHYLCGTLLAVHGGVPADVRAEDVLNQSWDQPSDIHWGWVRNPDDQPLSLGGRTIYQVNGHVIHPKAGAVKSRFAVDSGVYSTGILSAGLFYQGQSSILTVSAPLD